MRIHRYFVATVCLTVLVAVQADRSELRAQPAAVQSATAESPATAAPAAESPIGSPLDYLPSDALAAAVAEPSELLVATELEILGNVPLLGDMPIPASEFETVVFYATFDPLGGGGPSFGLILRLRHDIFRPTILKWLTERAVSIAEAPFPTYRTEGNFKYCAFPDRRTVVFAAEMPAEARPAGKTQPAVASESPVPAKLRALAEGGHFAAVVDIGRIRSLLDHPAAWSSGDPLVERLVALPRELGIVTVEFRFGKRTSDVRIDLARRTDGSAGDADALAAWTPQAAGDLDRLLRTAADLMSGSLWPHERPDLEKVVASISSALAEVRPRADGPAGALTAPAAPLTRLFLRVGEVMRPMVMSARNVARSNQLRNQLRMLTLARMNYEDKFGVPPSDIVAPDGRPLLSWRVRLLPFLDQEALYREFKLDEPWDGEHNKQLLEKMPYFFDNPADKHPGLTQLQGITGPKCLLPKPIPLAAIRDPKASTVWLVEAKQPVPWTKPADIPYADAGMHTRFNPDTRGHATWATVAGTVGTYPELTDATYRCLLQINDDGLLSDDDLNPQRAAKRPRPEQVRAALDAVARKADRETVGTLVKSYLGAVGLPAPLRDEMVRVLGDLMRSDDAAIRNWSTVTALQVTYGGRNGFDWKRFEEVVAQADADAFPQLAEAAMRGRQLQAARATAAVADTRDKRDAVEFLLQTAYSPEVVATLLTDPAGPVVERAAAVLEAFGTENEAAALAAVPGDSPASGAARRAVAAIEARAAAARSEREKVRLQAERGQFVDAANAALKSGKAVDARTAMLRVLDFEDRLHGNASDQALQTIDLLVNHNRRMGDADEAKRMLELKRDRLREHFGATHWKTREENALIDLQVKQRDAATEMAAARKRGEEALARAGKENEAKRLDATVAALREAVAAFEIAYGPESLATGNALRSLRRVLAGDKKYAEAGVEGKRLAAAMTKLLGEDHPLTVNDDAEVAFFTLLSGDTTGAIPLLRQVAPRLEAAGKSAEAATAYLVLADKLPADAADEAVVVVQNAVRLHDLAGNQTDAVRACLNLARLRRAVGDRAAAEAWCYDAHWRYRQSGLQDFAVMGALPILAELYEESGRRHLELIIRQTEEQMVAPVEGRPYVKFLHASVLTQLAGTQVALGDFALAEQTLDKVRQLTAGTPESPFQINARFYLAVIKEHAGDSAGAQRALEEALVTAENVAPARRAEVLAKLAELFLRRGAAADARSAAERAVETAAAVDASIRMKALRLKIEALLVEGKVNEAAAEYTALKSVFQTAEPKLADWRTWIDEAGTALRFGESDEARRLCIAGLEAARESGGDDGSAHAEALAASAPLLLRAGDLEGADRSSREALRLAREIVERSAYVLSPRQQIALAQAMRRSLDLRISTVLSRKAEPNELFAEIYRWKGDAMIRGRELGKLRKQEAVGPFYKQLQSITRRLAGASLGAADPAAARRPDLQAQQADVDRLAGIQELLEINLSASRLAYLDLEKTSDMADFTAALGDDQVFVDYFVFNRFDAARPEPEQHLLATLIRRGGAIRQIDLGPLAPIREAVGVWRESTGESHAAREAGDRLRKLIWDPLDADLKPGELTYVSPDGPLGAMPIFALPAADGKYLIESRRIALVPVPRLLPAIARADREADGAGVLLALGDVDYDGRPQTSESKPSTAPATVSAGTPAAGVAAAQTAMPGTLRYVRRGEAFSPLPGTAAEIEFLEAYHRKQGLGIEVLRRNAASEEAFRKRAPQCRILHVATHGFFAADGVDSAESAAGEARTQATVSPTRVFDAGLLSGLALAGANAAPIDGQDDGILTASEIAVLDLGRLELAVLSACETGLGKETDGEGLLGIQRAFQVAGARSTVAGYWKVDDNATRVLMERFYENCRTKNLGKLDALREAQIWMLDHPEEVRAAAARGVGRQVDLPSTSATDPKSPAAGRLSPRYWAAFALSGETGPIAPGK